MRRGAIAQIVVIAVLVAAFTTLVVADPFDWLPWDWLPESASVEMDRITATYWFATAISIGVFSVVAALLVYAIRTFRVQPDDDTDGPPIHGNTSLEIVWTVVPAVLVIAIGVLSAVVLSRNGEAGTNPYVVEVRAQQFAWSFTYPEEGDLTTSELVLPLDQKVQFEMRTVDVIHSFWVPQMGQKQDIVPGITTSILVTPTRTGTFPLVCTELCGLGHATMRSTVRVVTDDEFDSWVAEQSAAGDGGGTPE